MSASVLADILQHTRDRPLGGTAHRRSLARLVNDATLGVDIENVQAAGIDSNLNGIAGTGGRTRRNAGNQVAGILMQQYQVFHFGQNRDLFLNTEIFHLYRLSC